MLGYLSCEGFLKMRKINKIQPAMRIFRVTKVIVVNKQYACLTFLKRLYFQYLKHCNCSTIFNYFLSKSVHIRENRFIQCFSLSYF
jgi:hypothetical protein